MSRLTENDVNLRRVWCVVYDSDTPNMDGSVTPIRMADQSLEQAQRNLAVVVARSDRAAKRNLRIETRLVSDYEVFSSVKEADRG